jgi:hypothetical protein
MAYCDSCGNFDEQDRTLEESKEIESFRSDLYYYWDAPIEEDYNWRDALPAADCLCEICFDILNSEGKIKWI